MIYLIGGPPRCGKTTVARRLAALTCASWVPADYLGTAISGYIPEDEKPHRYPTLAFRDNDARYAQYSSAEIIRNYRTKAHTTWQAIQDFVDYALADEHDLILEGYQIEPLFVRQSLSRAPNQAIKAVFLYREDTHAIRDGLKRSTAPNDWVRSYTREEATFTKIAAMVGEYSSLFRDEAAKYGLPAFNMDGAFEQQVATVIAYLRA